MRSHRRAFAGFVPPVCLAAFTVSSGWWREILWRSLRPTAAMQKIYNTLLLCLNSFTSHLRLASDVMLIFNCHHLDWHCFGNLFVLVWKGHGCISLEKKMNVVWREFAWIKISWEIKQKDNISAGGMCDVSGQMAESLGKDTSESSV